ncbi:MAG: hypothetical protein ACRDV1_15510 [Actinomycetes bacterium]
MTSYDDRRGGNVGGWLLLFGIGYAVTHHTGTIFAGLGDVGDTRTRWADWIDLLTPFVVLGAAGAALRAGRASRGAWTAFWFAAVLYTLGQGIHLAANSVANAVPGDDPDPVHLWDEVIGHYLWYGGFALVVAALAATLSERRPRGGIGAHVVALLVGFTHFTNSVEGQTPVMGIVVAAAFTAWGLLRRDGLGRLLLSSYGFSFLLFVVFGLWQGGFPEFSDLGWI